MSVEGNNLKPVLARLADGARLDEADAEAAFETIMSGGATPAQIAAFLMALRLRGETVEEITGAARIMRAKALSIRAPEGAVDCCGTGGDGAGTVNISTAVSFVVAGAGVPVAKHGNRAASSKSGAADVLSALGVNLDAAPEVLEASLARDNICFLMAPKHHSAMKNVVPVRQDLGLRTIFNYLGPLSNPAGTRRQVIGVFAREWLEPLATVLGRLGAEAAWVVHGSDGLDELTTTGASFVAALKDGAVTTFEVTPEDAGLPRAGLDDLRGGDPATNATLLKAVLDGQQGAYRNIVLLNAAAVLIVAGKAATLKEGAGIAADAIDSGRAAAALAGLVAATNAG